MDFSTSDHATSVLGNTQAVSVNSSAQSGTDQRSGRYGLRPRSEEAKIQLKLSANERFDFETELRSKKARRRRLRRTRQSTIAASIREKKRCEMFNTAFKNLREVMHYDAQTGGRLSKLATLKLAINYIANLSSVLCDNDTRLPNDEDVSRDTGKLKDLRNLASFDVWASSVNCKYYLWKSQDHISSWSTWSQTARNCECAKPLTFCQVQPDAAKKVWSLNLSTTSLQCVDIENMEGVSNINVLLTSFM